MIEDLKRVSENLTLTELVDKVLDVTGMKKELEDENTLVSEGRLENLEEFKSITKTFEERDGIVSLEEFLLETSLLTDVNEYKNDPNRVSLMTVHSVKGLEFDYVFVVGLEEGIFPPVNSLMDNSELEEERRLMYVAVTRAKEKLFLVNSRMRTLFGKEQSNPASRFISEIEDDLLDKAYKEKENEKSKLNKEELFHKDSIDYVVGDFVYHDVFGQGKIIELSGSIATIAFKHPHGIKKLMKNHKSIKKI